MMYVVVLIDTRFPLTFLAAQDACAVLASKAPPEVKAINVEEAMTDSYRAIRTNVGLLFHLA